MLLALLLGIETNVPSAAQSSPQWIRVIAAQGSGAHAVATEALVRHLRLRAPDVEVVVEAADERAGGVPARGTPPAVVVALGTAAVAAARRDQPSVPLVASMLLRAEDVRQTPNATGVYLEFDPDDEFRLLGRILPGIRRVGVLYSGTANKLRADAAARVAEPLGLRIQAEAVGSPDQIPTALQRLAEGASALWIIPDTLVVSPRTVQPLILFSFRTKIPLIGLSAAWVRAGALFALDRDYDDIGVQTAELAVKLLAGNRDVEPVGPRKYSYSINQRTADLMNIRLPKEIVAGAAVVVK